MMEWLRSFFAPENSGNATAISSTQHRSMNITVNCTTYKDVRLEWNAQPGAKNYTVEIRKDYLGLLSLPLPNGKYETYACNFKIPIALTAGVTYNITVEANQLLGEETLAKGTVSVRADFTQKDLELLLTKASAYVRPGGMESIKWLYRNKPDTYFKDIEQNHNGIMKPYIKDNNGDPASVINGKINGLFFASHLQQGTGQPPSNSIFGNERVYLPASVLTDAFVRLYFADFYCHRTWHYVTVVKTTIGSEADRFCMDKLIELDKLQNDFLMPRFNNTEVAKLAHVEVFYTDDINLNTLSDIGGSRAMVCSGGRTSRPGGIPKRAGCTICNLYTT